MAMKPPEAVLLSMTVRLVPDVHGGLPGAGWCCLDCQEALDVHQPDACNPTRLLGTCGTCGGWYILDVEESGSVQTLLPAPEHLRQAVGKVADTAGPHSRLRRDYLPPLGA